jgi:RHS repeat-associated protein
MIRIERSILTAMLGLLVALVTMPAAAQLAPMGAHYGDRPSDTGFTGRVNATGGYDASVPLDMPPTRDGLPVPLRIVSGGRTVGAAGLGWDVPLSYVRIDTSIARRRPQTVPNSAVQGRERVTLSISGQTMELVRKGSLWVPRSDGALFTATQTASAWLAYDGQGHTYSFTEPAGHTGMGLWLLTTVSGPGGVMMRLSYDVVAVALSGGSGLSIDLTSVAYNIHPSMGCAKHQVDLVYDANAAAPLSLSVLAGQVVARMHKLTTVDIKARSSCASAVSLRKYQLRYDADVDTQQPRLSSVTLVGRDGTPEATAPVPVATYRYGSATSAGGLTYTKTATIAAPAAATGFDPTQISSTATSSLSTPGSGQTYATFQSLTDIDGDGRADLIFSRSGSLWVADNKPSGSASTWAAPVVLGDSPLLINGPLEARALTQNRFSQGTGTNKEHVWKQAIDINGDGRVDIVDAGKNSGQWTVYLNTPGTGASGVVWQERVIPIASIVRQLLMNGHVLEDNNRLPLSRRFTGTEYKTDASNGDIVNVGAEYTYTEWALRDINGDGYPDFVYNSAPVQVLTANVTGALGEPLIAHIPMPGPGANAVEVLYDVGGVTLDQQGATPYREMFSLPVILLPNTGCGVEQWQTEVGPPPSKHKLALQRCSFMDITGDGIPERIDRTKAYIGLASGFSNVTVPMPLAATGRHWNAQSEQCLGAQGSTPFQSFLEGGLRDLTGDGIPDLALKNQDLFTWTLYVGTGTGFAAPIPLNRASGLNLSTEYETCDGKSSRTLSGFFDVDGDGRAEFVEANYAGGYDISTIAGGSAPGNPEAGQLTSIENGYGARTNILYRSAKQDATTSHGVPFPENVVSDVYTTLASQPFSDNFHTKYAYGGATMIYDGIHGGYVFPGYQRSVSLRNDTQAGVKSVGEATITDVNGLTPYVWGSTNAQRFDRLMLVGRTSRVTTMSGYLGDSPWALLTADVVNDVRISAQTTYGWTSRLFTEVAPPPASVSVLDCFDYGNPYDYDASLSEAWTGYNVCSAHGFMYAARTYSLRGSPSSSTANVATATNVLSVDDYGRPTSVNYLNDVYRSDDDLCVDTTYASPTGAGAQILSAPYTQRVWGCAKNSTTYSADTFFYDNLAGGSVSAGLVTSHLTERHATDTGALLSVIRLFDASYDAVGNVVSTIGVRDDGAVRQSKYEYDPFGLVLTRTVMTGSGVPAMTSATTFDPVSLDPLATTDVNQTRRSITYDGFGRALTTAVTPPGGALGVLSLNTYLGFTDGSGRRITMTSFDDLVPPSLVGSVTGHTATVYLDELGREVRTEVGLGVDYGNQTLVTGYRTYDTVGRVSFAAGPFLSTDSPKAAYGVTRFYNVDGTPNCFVKGTGPQAFTAVTDLATETLPTCYYHGYSNHMETFGVSAPDANLSTSSQAGVLKIQTSTAIGRPVSRSTTKAGVALEYSTFAHDRLGNLITSTRYKTPASTTNPVTTSWRYDSRGQVLQKQDPEGALTTTSYDSWGSPTMTQWSDTGTFPATDRRIATRFDALGRMIHREEQNNGVADPETSNDYVYDVGVAVSSEVSPTYMLGRLGKASSPTGQVYYSYDAFGAVSAETHVDAFGTRYIQKNTLRPDGSALALDLYLPDTGYANEHIDYFYDSAARNVAVDFTGTSKKVNLYKATTDVFGRVSVAQYGGATTYQVSYAPAGRRLLKALKVSSAMGYRAYEFPSYDAVGRELSRSEEQSGAIASTTTEKYDALGRLARSHTVQGTTTSSSWSFTYDALGNAGALHNGTGPSGAALAYRTIDEDELCRVGYPTLGGTACNVTHDVAGNVVDMPTRTGSRQLTYFSSGQVRSIRDGSNTATFRYDPLGAVQELDLDGPTTDTRRDRHYGALFEVRDHIVAGVRSSVISRKIPGPGGLVATLRGASLKSLVFAFGEPRGTRFTTDIRGNFLQDVSYQPFGEATSTGVAPGSPLYTNEQWNGGDALSAFGLTQVGARIYDPVIGRFLSRDPLTIVRSAATSNPYAFSANDPVNRSDPTGRDWGDPTCGAECQGGFLSWNIQFGGGGGPLLGGHRGGGGTGSNPSRPKAPPISASPSSYPSDGVGDDSAMWPKWKPSMWPRWKDGPGIFERIDNYFALSNALDAGNYDAQIVKDQHYSEEDLDAIQSFQKWNNRIELVHGAVGLANGLGELGLAFDMAADRAIAGLGGSIRNVNKYVKGTENCGPCAIATDATLAGNPASALPSGPTHASAIAAWYGGKSWIPANGPMGIKIMMDSAGGGARGIVWGTRVDALGSPIPGHFFNVVNQKGIIRFLDGQTGTVAKTTGFEQLYLLFTNVPK